MISDSEVLWEVQFVQPPHTPFSECLMLFCKHRLGVFIL